MPYSVKREKELLTALLTQEMGLVRAMSYFSKSASSLDKKASGLGLRGLENYDLIKNLEN